MRKSNVLVNEEREPRLLAYMIGSIIAVSLALAANCLLLDWPIKWPLVIASTLLAMYGVFSIETVVEGCVVSMVTVIPLVVVLLLKPDFSMIKQAWLGATCGLFVGKIWVGIIR